MEIIKRENMATKVDANDWEEAIKAAGQILVDSKDIKYGYVEAMIEAVKELGPYIVLTPGFALAHARPSEEVIRNSMSLITLKEPISFGSPNDPVKVILCLACVDQNSHLASLQKVAGKLMEDETIDKLSACVSVDELYNLIND